MTHAAPIFSVIIPTYQRPTPLARCLEALTRASASRDAYEVIVVDDGGEVSLEEIVAPFRGRMAVRLVRRTNGGPASARNTGASLARGQFLAFTDDDCLPMPGWLDALAAALRAEPHRMVGGRVRNTLTGNVYSTASQVIIDLVYAYYNADPQAARFFASNNMAVPAETFRALGGFAPAFRTSEDRDLCDRWLAAGYPLIYAPEAVVEHAHVLTLSAFWSQHVAYGRGAWRFLRAHIRRTGARSTLDLSFYAALLRRLPAVLRGFPPGTALTLAGLMGLWQVANLAGFVAEASQGGADDAHR